MARRISARLRWRRRQLSGECRGWICCGDACADGGLFGGCDASGFDFGGSYGGGAGGRGDKGSDGDDADLECGPGDEWTECDLYRECGCDGASVAAPTGVVTFLDGSTVLGTKTLVGSGVASFSTASLSVGSHAITASYAGDANSAASVSTVLMETVNGYGDGEERF